MNKIKSLMEGLFEEMNRVRKIIIEYKSLPNNVGMIGATLMEIDIKNAEKAISEDNVVEMLVVYEKLKNIE